MRALMFVTAAALSLSACKGQEQSENRSVADEGLTADKIATNDVTAIDAVTAAAANMAADVNYMEVDDSLESGANATTVRGTRAAAPNTAGNTARPPARERPRRSPAVEQPADEQPAGNGTE